MCDMMHTQGNVTRSWHQEINLEFVTVCDDMQQSFKAHGLTCQLLRWGYNAPCVCVRVYVCVCMWVHVGVRVCDSVSGHVCVLVCLGAPMCLRLSISHHLWFTNILVTWTQLSTEVHQTLLTCSGDVIHP